MATGVVTNTLVDPAGNPVTDGVVTAALWPAGTQASTPSGVEAPGTATATTDGTGSWSLTLERTDTLTPSTCLYRVHERSRSIGLDRVTFITMTDTGTATLAARQASSPLAPILTPMELPNGYAEKVDSFTFSPIPTAGIANAQDVPGLMVQVVPARDMTVEIVWQYPVQTVAGGFAAGNFNAASLIDDVAMTGGSTYAQAEVDRVTTLIGAYGTVFCTRNVRRVLTRGTTYRWKVSAWVGSGTPTGALCGNMSAVLPASVQIVQVG